MPFSKILPVCSAVGKTDPPVFQSKREVENDTFCRRVADCCHDQLKQALACLADQLPSSAPYRTCPAVAAVAAHWAQKCN